MSFIAVALLEASLEVLGADVGTALSPVIASVPSSESAALIAAESTAESELAAHHHLVLVAAGLSVHRRSGVRVVELGGGGGREGGNCKKLLELTYACDEILILEEATFEHTPWPTLFEEFDSATAYLAQAPLLDPYKYWNNDGFLKPGATPPCNSFVHTNSTGESRGVLGFPQKFSVFKKTSSRHTRPNSL